MATSIGYPGMLNWLRSAMGKLKIVEELFKGRHFDRGIVILCVRWYLRFNAIITTTPNELCAELHNRMPVVLVQRFQNINRLRLIFHLGRNLV
jgi:hypothetical protein